MENKDVKSGSGIPEVGEEERKNRKTTKRLSKEWYCDVCKNGRNYTLAGKSSHLKTKKHIKKTDYTHILIQPKSMNRKVWLEFIKNDVMCKI